MSSLFCCVFELDTHLFEDAESDTRSEELAEMLGRELAKRAGNMPLDSFGLGFGLCRVVRDEGRGEIGVVDRVVDGDGDLEGGAVVHDGTGDTCPHRLMNERCEPTRNVPSR